MVLLFLGSLHIIYYFCICKVDTMATNSITGQNQVFPIYNQDGTPFNDIVLRKASVDSVVMSLGDKITGDVYYPNNSLNLTMLEYIVYNGVKYTLVNPPTIIREGLVNDNSELKGMTKYSFEFYHPMYQLGNLPFSDVAVSSDEQRYLSENKVFNWIGKPDDYIAKLNKNLENTQWVVVKSAYFPVEKLDVLSEVLSFDKATIADALKTWYDTWEVPFIVDVIKETDPLYAQGKRFSVIVGFPAEEILDTNGNPYIFKMGQGVGLKNNSRTPKNNKIVTRISPYGSERNIPYGYPQIVWTGNQDWEYTIDNNPDAENSYPIYDGIVGGQNVRLIKHPFTRKTLMPSIYATLVNKKVNPNATGYDPTIELVDYYDATSEDGYPNPINPLAPSYESHEFSEIYPRLGEESILGAEPYDTLEEQGVDGYLNERQFLATILNNCTSTKNEDERTALLGLYNALNNGVASYHSESQSGDDYQFVCDVTSDEDFYYVKYISSNINYDVILLKTGHTVPVAASWNDKMDDDGNYIQSYFKITLPVLNFDMYACASITEEMEINMRSGACIGCTFNVAIDWDDYKRNFYDENGNFAPNGSQRDLTKYPKTNDESVTLIVQKDIETFGTLMPNIYQQPESGDKFVVLGISLPTSYIVDAEQELDEAAKQYMLENNVYYYEYPLKFDEYFLAKNVYILNQIKPNSIVRFKYNGEQDNMVLYVKQITIKYGQGVLPQYDITITDDIEVVLNKIGQVTDDVSRLRLDLSQLMQYYNDNTSALEELKLLLADKLSKVSDDTAQGFIKFLQGLQVGERFVSGILGEGGVFRRNEDGKVYLETDNLYVRMKAYFDTIEVRHYKHSSGNRIASNAGIHCSRVSWIDASGNQTQDINNAVKFRCFFRATDGDDTVENYFMAASDGNQDLAFCDKTSLNSGISKRRYWRAVVGKNSVLTDDGEAWIDLSKSDCENGSDIPMAGDDIIQLGNRTDSERQGAIIEYVNGNDAPSYHIYQFINDFNLSNKNIIRIGFNSMTGRAEMNVYGDAYIGDPNGSTYVKYNQVTKKVEIKADVSIQSTFGGQTLEERVVEYAPTFDDSEIWAEMANLQDQIDGAIETYYMTGEPSLSLPPVISTQAHPYDNPWLDGTETPAERTKILNNHVGDLYYDKETGRGYRFMYDDENQEFLWTELTDADVAEALRVANEAKDTADGKRTIYSVWGAWIKSGVNTLEVGDLFIPTSDTTQGGVTYKAKKVYKCTTEGTNTFQEIDYTDDTALNNFVSNTYNPFVTNIQGQVDGKSETWRQATNPANSWSTAADKEKHVGDLWMDTSSNGGKKTYIYVDNGSDANPRYTWEAQDVPDAVFDEIDGKADVFVSKPTTYNINDLWIIESTIADVDLPSGCVKGDIVISSTKRTNSYNKADWKKKDRYTDDSALDTFKLDQYVQQLTNGTISGDITTAQNTAKGAATAAAALNYLSQALGQDTTISGGLVLSTLIGLRDGNNQIWSGINGAYTSSAAGGGIAAWYGGAMVDKEVSTTATDYAKSLFRFDGSGYLASGNISWNEQGQITIKNITTLSDSQDTNILNELATFNSAFSFATSGQGSVTVLSITPNVQFTDLRIGGSTEEYKATTRKWVNDNYLSISFFDELFQLYNNTTKINPNGTLPIDKTNLNIKAMFGFWTEQYLSALGLNSQGGGGGGATSLDDLVNVAIASPTDGQVLKYNAQTHKWVNGNDEGVTSVLWSNILNKPTTIGGYGITDAYISNGVIHIGGVDITPLTSFTETDPTVPAWAKAASKPSYAFSEITGTASASQIPSLDASKITSGTFDVNRIPNLTVSKITDLSTNYLALGGGTMNGRLNMQNTVRFYDLEDNTSQQGYGYIQQDSDGLYVAWSDGVNLSKILYVDGDTDITGALSVTGNTDMTGYLNVTGTIRQNNLPVATQNYVSTNYLPLLGGTVNGVLRMGNNAYVDVALYFKDQYASQGTNRYAWMQCDEDGLNLYFDTDVTEVLNVVGGANFTNDVIIGTKLGIGVTNALYALHVAGSGYLSSSLSVGANLAVGGTLKIGDIYIAYDSTNNALKVYKLVNGAESAANFYALGGVSALGYSASGGGGGGASSLSELTDVQITNVASGQILRYDGTHWINITPNYATTTQLANYLPLSGGGTITGNNILMTVSSSGLSWKIGNTSYGSIVFSMGNSGPVINLSSITKYNGYDIRNSNDTYIDSANSRVYIGGSYIGVGGTYVAFGTAGADYVPITIGSTTKNVLTNHQSLSGYATQSWVNTQLGNYLPLTGGTMSGTLTMSDDIIINGNNNIIFDVDSTIYSDRYGTNDFRLYINGLGGVRIAVSGGQTYLDISDSGVNINGNAIIHAGNIASQSVSRATTATYATYDPEGNILASEDWVQSRGYITSSSLSNYLALTGGTLTGDLKFNNNVALYLKDTSNTDVTGLWLTANNQFFIARGCVENGYDTYLCGKDLYISTGNSAWSTIAKFDSSGNVGIGTTSPSHKLDVSGACGFDLPDISGVDAALTLSSQNFNGDTARGKGVAIRLGHYNNGNYCSKIACVFENQNPNYLQPSLAFYTMYNTYLAGSEVERMRIASNGNVGIGTSSPSYKLDVNGSINGTTVYENGNAIATQTWVNNKGYLTSSSISDMATKTWVGQQGYLTSLSLGNLTNVSLTSTTNGQVLTYQSSNGTWVNKSITFPVTSVCGNTGVITATQIATALGLSGYATQTWVGNNYLPLTGGTLTGALTVNSSITFGLANYQTLLVSDDSGATFSGANGGYFFDSDIYINSYQVATRNWVSQQGYLTSAPVTSVAGYTGAVTVANLATALSLSNYATETWVTNQGYITSSGSCNYATSAGSAQILGCNVAQGSTSLADGDVLVYDSGAWYNVARSTYLSGYATETWVNNKGYVTSSGVTSVATGTGLTGGTITSSGTISINSTYQTYISHGESAYNSLGNYLPLTGGTLSANNHWLTPARLQLLRQDDTKYTDRACIGVTNGNLHIDSYPSHSIYLNHYSGNTTVYIGTSTVIHSGNIGSQSVAYATSAGSATDSTKLPLTGGTLTGDLKFNNNVALYLKDTSNTDVTGLWLTANNQFFIARGCVENGYDTYLCGKDLYISTGNSAWSTIAKFDSSGNVGIGTTSPSHKLDVSGACGFDLPDISGVDAALTLSSQNFNGDTARGKGVAIRLGHYNNGNYCSKIACVFENQNPNYLQPSLAFYTMYNTYLAGSEVERMRIASNGNVGIGTSSPSYKLDVNGQAMINQNVGIGTAPASSYALDIDGTARATSFVNNSDIRKKDVLNYDAEPQFYAVANAPAIRFKWKERSSMSKDMVCIGSVAQYWQSILPEAVMTDEKGYLSMQYDVIALFSAIATAKRVVEHERRIEQLERENALLRMEINELKEVA